MNTLNTVDILTVSYDKGTTPIKISVSRENRARANIELDSGSAISEVPITPLRRVHPNHKKVFVRR